MADLTLIIAFIAGLASFLSPCILPLIPAFLSYLTGISAEEIKTNPTGARFSIIINTMFFILGFSLIFSLLGVLINSLFSNIAYDLRVWTSRVGGVIIILFGLYLIGLLKIPFLEREYKFKVKKFRYSYLTSFVFGVSFAVGWTPCISAVLGSVFTLAATLPAKSFSLLLAYSLGLAIPFLVTGLFVSRISNFIQKYSNTLIYITKIMGVILIILGILVFTNKLELVANYPFVNRLLLR